MHGSDEDFSLCCESFSAICCWPLFILFNFGLWYLSRFLAKDLIEALPEKARAPLKEQVPPVLRQKG